MSSPNLADLQARLRDTSGFTTLEEYSAFCRDFLTLLASTRPTRIVSPRAQHYIFYQFGAEYGHPITRPLNTNLFLESPDEFQQAFARFVSFLGDLQRHEASAADRPSARAYVASNQIDAVVYTMQQACGSVADSLTNANQSRKRIGTLFETLIKQIIQRVGVICEPRTVKIPVPGFSGYTMSYELDLVFSHNKAILAAETQHIHPTEIVGSVKTTSKDRIDKIFLDKFLLTKLLGRDIPVVAIFLHDVQRATTRPKIPAAQGPSFGIASTFKKGHFLGYTVALNRLDGVYYVDPRPEMLTHELLREQIRVFRQFLTTDLWTFSVEHR